MLAACSAMSQKPTTSESKLSGQGSDTLSPISSVGEAELDVAILGPGPETDNIRQLLNEFKGLHEQRLRCLELGETTSEDLLWKKVNFLQSYVDDLADQNQVLVQTIEELQKDANDKNDMKLHTSDRSLEDGNQRRTAPERSVCTERKDPRSGVNSVTQSIRHTGHMCAANVSGPDVRTLSLAELVGPAAHIPHSAGSLIQIASDLEDLRIQLQAKDMVISDLEKELAENLQQKQKAATQVLESGERLVHLQGELTCLQRLQKDNVREIAEKDICITKLQAQVQLLQQEGADAHTQLCELGATARELQEELRRREEGWRQREDQQRGKYEKEHQRAEERRREEEEKNVEERNRREEEWKRGMEEERQAHAEVVKVWAEKAASLISELTVSRKQVERQNAELSELRQKEETLLSEIRERDEHVRHLDQDVVALRATQDSLKRTLATKEQHAHQLVRDNTELRESLASLQRKLQTSECASSGLSETLDRTRTDLESERQRGQRIQDRLQSANQEVERLQRELIHSRRAAEKKIQKREIKLCALLKELTATKSRHSERQNKLLQREAALEKVCEERDELRAKMEDRGRERVHLDQTKERLEADLALSHEKLHTSHLEVRSRDQLILQLRAEMKTAEQTHQRTQEQVASLEGELRHLKRKVSERQEEARRLREKVGDIERLKDQKEREQQQLRDRLSVSQQQVETLEGKLEKREAEMEVLLQQLQGTEEELKDAGLHAQGQRETAAIFKQKYTAAMEKVHRVQGRVELLEEELQYSQQQLRESQAATHSVKEELTEMARRYQEKVGQWENSQEALDQLTDELQANQNLLKEGQQKADQLKGLVGAMGEQVDTLRQQKLVLECDLRLYQQSHSHTDEEHLSLLSHRQQLQKRCAEQVERLAECEKAILQMKSELERQAQEKAGLKQSLVTSRHTHISDRGQLEQEVLRLKKEVARLELELADTQKIHVALLRRSEEELREAREEAARGSSEAGARRGEVQRLRKDLQEEEEARKSAVRQKQSLSGRVGQLGQELEELRRKHRVTVEELAARAEEARQMEGRLNEGKLAEGKIRSLAARLETEVAELRRNLQLAVDHKLGAERETQDARGQVDTLQAELEGTRSDNAKLRHESQLVMTNVNRWIAEQKTSNESLAAQMKAQSKVLLIVTEEREHLQESNDTLKAEVKRLKEVADERARDTERFKAEARVRDQSIRQDERTVERQGCVALNLGKIEDMQTRLRRNLEAIGMLNQQLNALSGENKRLRRQLEEERSARLFPPPPPPPPPPASQQRRRSVHHSPLPPPAQCPPTFSSSLRLSTLIPPPLRSPEPGFSDGGD